MAKATNDEWTEEREAAFQEEQRVRFAALAAQRAAEAKARQDVLKGVLPALIEDKPIKLSDLEEKLRAIPGDVLPAAHVNSLVTALGRVRSVATAIDQAAAPPAP